MNPPFRPNSSCFLTSPNIFCITAPQTAAGRVQAARNVQLILRAGLEMRTGNNSHQIGSSAWLH